MVGSQALSALLKPAESIGIKLYFVCLLNVLFKTNE